MSENVPATSEQVVVSVRDLRVEVPTSRGPQEAVAGVSFELRRNETIAIVGESGSGKSLTVLAVAGLTEPPVRVASGTVVVDGVTSTAGAVASGHASVGVVFQNPMSSLNPAMRVGDQVAEAIVYNQNLSRKDARQRAQELLGLVGIKDASQRMRDYPHQFSGGMRQRVMIAMALGCAPSVLIADEPTTALDVTVQREVMDLLDELKRTMGLAMILVSHDLALVSEVADRVAVMYAGELVESGPTDEVLGSPRHPYVRGLIRCMPEEALRRGRLMPLEGYVPHPGQVVGECRFAARCAHRIDACVTASPPLEVTDDGHEIRCIRWRELLGGEDR